MLKIFNIAWAHSIHTERWVKWFVARGHEVYLASNVEKEIENVKVYGIDNRVPAESRLERYKQLHFNFKCKPLYIANRVLWLRKLIEEVKPDVLHSHCLWYPGYLGSYLNFHPFVITGLDGDVLWRKENVSFVEKIRTKSALRKADLFTGNCLELINASVSHGVKKENAHVIRRGLDLKKFNLDEDKKSVRNQLKLPVDKRIILSSRSLASFYNLETIIKIIPDLVSKIEDILFVFIWPGKEDGAELKKLADRLGVSKYIRFIGRVEHEIVALYQKSADLTISIPSYDSGPITLQEAMACGSVPVVTDLDCNRELIKDGYNGFLIDPSNHKRLLDVVITVLSDVNLRKQIIEINSEIAKEKCDEEKEMKKMEDLYYQLLEKK